MTDRPVDTLKSIETLERERWGEPPGDATRLVKRCYLLRQKPIGQLEIEDLRLLLRQGIGVVVILPSAVSALEADLFAEGDLYPGDLLQSVLSVSDEHWKAHPELREKLRSILRRRKGEVNTRSSSEEIRRDLTAAIDRFFASD